MFSTLGAPAARRDLGGRFRVETFALLIIIAEIEDGQTIEGVIKLGRTLPIELIRQNCTLQRFATVLPG